MIDEQTIFLEATSHIGQRRRERIKGHYYCENCQNHFIAHRPAKESKCPICFEDATLVATVDEFAIQILKLSCENVVPEVITDDQLASLRLFYFNRKDIKSSRSQRIQTFVKKANHMKG